MLNSEILARATIHLFPSQIISDLATIKSLYATAPNVDYQTVNLSVLRSFEVRRSEQQYFRRDSRAQVNIIQP